MARKRGKGKKGVCGVDDGEAEDASDEEAEDHGDLDLGAVEDAMETCTGQTGGAPGLLDLDTFDPWAKYLGLESEANPCGELSWRDVGETLYPIESHRRPAPAPTATNHSQAHLSSRLREMHASVEAFVNPVPSVSRE